MLNSRARLAAGFLSASAVTLAFGALGFFGIQDASVRRNERLLNADSTRRAADLAGHAKGDFEAQLRDWRDLLLRGHAQPAFDLYFAAFAEKEAATQKDLLSLKVEMAALGLRTEAVDGALQSHAELGARYREALKRFDLEDLESSAVVNGIVTGFDDPLAAKIAGLAESVAARAEDTWGGARFDARGHASQFISGAAILVGFLVSLSLGITLSMSFTRPVCAVAEAFLAGAENASTEAAELSSTGRALPNAAREHAS
jgi:hypothetical protein